MKNLFTWLIVFGLLPISLGLSAHEHSPPVQAAPLVKVPSGLAAGVLMATRDKAQQRYLLHWIDPATGKEITGSSPIQVAQSSHYYPVLKISPNGAKLAIVSGSRQVAEAMFGGTAYWPNAEVLQLVDLRTAQEVTATLSGKGRVEQIRFAPEGQQVALVQRANHQSTVMLFDTTTGAKIVEQTVGISPEWMEYTQGGTSLLLYGTPPAVLAGVTKPEAPRLLLLDAKTLATRWQQPLPSILSGQWCVAQCDQQVGQRLLTRWQPAIALAPNGRKLYIVHADAEKLTTVDLDQRQVESTEIRRKSSWLDTLLNYTARKVQAKEMFLGVQKSAALSPDGTQLYAVGQTMSLLRGQEDFWQGYGSQLDLYRIDTATGAIQASLRSPGNNPRLTPDGSYLLLDGWDRAAQWTKVYQADTLQEVATLTGWSVTSVQGINGQWFLLAEEPLTTPRRFGIVDTSTFTVTQPWPNSDLTVLITP